MLSAGIVGGAGYTAGELVRLLVHHPAVRLGFVQSASHAGEPLGSVHAGVWESGEMRFVAEGDPASVDVLFLCTPHGESARYMATHRVPAEVRVIDLSQDFRDGHDGFVYGLPELGRERIAAARRVANPGCFATAIQLTLLPLAAAGRLQSEVHVTAVTGATGAGAHPSPTTHFSWRADNLSVYKAFRHQHLGEIVRTLHRLQPAFDRAVNFVPIRGDYARGILASVYTDFDGDETALRALYTEFYRTAAFTQVASGEVDLKQVTNTNHALVQATLYDGKAHLVAVLDNLLKGASGQAVQNMNLMTGLDERAGLHLKANAF